MDEGNFNPSSQEIPRSEDVLIDPILKEDIDEDSWIGKNWRTVLANIVVPLKPKEGIAIRQPVEDPAVEGAKVLTTLLQNVYRNESSNIEISKDRHTTNNKPKSYDLDRLQAMLEYWATYYGYFTKDEILAFRKNSDAKPILHKKYFSDPKGIKKDIEDVKGKVLVYKGNFDNLTPLDLLKLRKARGEYEYILVGVADEHNEEVFRKWGYFAHLFDGMRVLGKKFERKLRERENVDFVEEEDIKDITELRREVLSFYKAYPFS